MKSIYHITFAPITDYLAYGLQIDTCLQNNYQVKILDISAFFNFPKPHHSEKYQHLVVQLNTYRDLEDYILQSDAKKTIVNIQITYEWRFRKIFRMMAKLQQYHFSIFLLGQLPFHTQMPLWKKVFTTSTALVPTKVTTRLISNFLFKIHKLKLQNILFYAGENLANSSGRTHKFPINFFDYDRFLEDSVAQDEGYAVFLDDGLFQHPDDKIVGNIVEDGMLERYRASLNRYFDFIEQEMKIKIIISPHPKVKHTLNFFGNREIVRNSSRELVKNASMVFCHCSSSLSFAVCYNKPLFFLTNTPIIKFSKKFQPLEQYIENFSKHLGRPLINMDEALIAPTIDQLRINEEKYNNFKISYLTTHETTNTLTKDIIMSYLDQIIE